MTLKVGISSLLLISTLSQTQQTGSAIQSEKPSLTITSQAVLVDVIVTDSSGKPVTGLPKGVFTVTEQGKPQTISFFEEHGAAPPAQAVEMPKLPPDVFTNFSSLPQPPAVNVLLLDSLNTRMEDQSYVHAQAMKFLMSAKPGTRTAIFTMGLGLHFIQGFNDDPAVLMSALGNKKNNEVESSVMLKGQDESNAQQNVIGMMSAQAPGSGTIASPEMIGALQRFFAENDSSRSSDRMYVTLANLQRLSAFLQGFPGRKNIIWFAEKVPAVYATASDTSGPVTSGTPAMNDEIKRTLAMLAAARAAIYPVDARGVSGSSLYTAENNLSKANTQPSQILGGDGAFVTSMRSDDMERNAGKASAQLLAEQSGGRAFANTNGLSDVIDKVTSDSGYFYTLSYSPTNAKMDGSFRNLEVKVAGGKYGLSYRRGYFAVDAALPGGAMSVRNEKVAKLAGQNPGAVDPLLPFMDLGMPQSEQILYKVRIVPAAVEENERVEKKDKNHYKVEFAIDLNDLKLNLDANGLHEGTLNISLIVYDRYGNLISREDHVVELNIKPDAYAVFQKDGVQLHTELAVPKGNYWLRTGVYDQASRKVGTMEVALNSVVPLPVSTATLRMKESETAKISVPVPPPSPVLPVRAAKRVTVEQLEHMLANTHGKRDQDLAKQLGSLELSERLSSSRLAKFQADVPGEKSRLALLVLADASVFLQPPAAEVLATAPPDAGTQNLILHRAAEDLASSIRRLPDFFARQTTNRFHDLKVTYVSPASAPVILEHQAFQPLDNFSDTVYYRNGQEVEESSEKQSRNKSLPRNGLVNWGVFGPLQRIVVTDILKGKMEWSHWEQRESGPVAVFRYSIPKEESNYIVKYCCFGTPNTGLRSFESIPPFHGEIAIDPATGAVYRLVLITALSPSDPVFQAEIMVEYEPVEIGGRMYICPRKSVTITTALAQILRQGCWGFDGATGDCGPMVSFKPKDTAINDTQYDSYHVFRSEMRILPEGDE
jgi:VWFA-related protein